MPYRILSIIGTCRIPVGFYLACQYRPCLPGRKFSQMWAPNRRRQAMSTGAGLFPLLANQQLWGIA